MKISSKISFMATSFGIVVSTCLASSTSAQQRYVSPAMQKIMDCYVPAYEFTNAEFKRLAPSNDAYYETVLHVGGYSAIMLKAMETCDQELIPDVVKWNPTERGIARKYMLGMARVFEENLFDDCKTAVCKGAVKVFNDAEAKIREEKSEKPK